MPIININPPAWTKPFLDFAQAHPVVATALVTAPLFTLFGYWLGR